jgi:hypothetical protein
MNSNWGKRLINQLVTWFTRRRNLGFGLVFLSSTLLVAVASGGFSVESQGVAGLIQAFKFSTGEGLPGHLQSLLVYLGAVTWLIGVGLVVHSFMQEAGEARVTRIAVIEMRGLVDTSDHPLKNAVPPSLVGRIIDCLVNVRPHLVGRLPNVDEALQEIGHIQRDVRRARGDSARENVKVIAGGVMQVPLLFYAGTQLDDEGKVVILDWERTAGRWKELLEPDDGTRFTISGLDEIGNASEVVVAVSASYLAALNDIEKTFPGIPVVHLARPVPEPNSLWSEDTQAALTQQFLQTLAILANRGVKTVHLVLAAPSSLCIRFGMAYDQRNMPNLRCYQRERDHVPPYPWSVRMPTAVLPAAYLPTPESLVVAS